jgi:hypothetical protein
VADPSRLYDIVDREGTVSGAVLSIMAPQKAAPYTLLPSNGLQSREDINLTGSGYAVDSYLYNEYNASEFAFIDNPEINSFIGPVLNITAGWINEAYASTARYNNGDRAYSIWLSSYISPSVVGIAANGRGLTPKYIPTRFGNMTFVQIANGTTFCSWYGGGLLKMLAYSGSMTCYQAINISQYGALNASLLGKSANAGLNITGGSRLGNYAGVSGAANYAATLSLLGNSSFVYAKISNHTVVSNFCYGSMATVNGINYCSTYVIPISGKIGGADELIKTTAYIGTHNLTAMSLSNSLLLSYQVATNIGIIKSFNITGTPMAFQSGLVNTCSFNSSLPCSRPNFGNGNLTFTLKNGMNQSVKLNRLSCYANNVLVQNSIVMGAQVAAHGTYNVTVPCYNILGRISGVALNLNLNLQLNYSVANVTRTLPGQAYILIGGT